MEPEQLAVGPDFIGIGLQKCGSTYLFRALQTHPQILFPATAARLGNIATELVDGVQINTLPKEVHFLNGHHRDIGWDRYLKLFDGAGAGIKTGEITPRYAAAGLALIAELKSNCPNLRILALIRHPVARDWSAIRMIAKRQSILGDVAALTKIANMPQVLAMGDYGPQLANWRSVFGDQLHIASCEQLAQDPQLVVTDICRFLGLQPHNDLPAERIHAGPDLPCPPEIAALLAARHQPRLPEIARLTGVDYTAT